METNAISFVKSFGFGFILGYLAGFLIRKGLKVCLVILIVLGIVLYLTGLWETISSVWTWMGEFILGVLNSIFLTVKERIEIYFSNTLWVMGFLAGLAWSIVD